MIPADLKYTREHEWVRVEGDQAVVGITHYAQDSLGDIVYVELPKEGATVQQFKPFGVVESVKSVSDLYAPLSGVVVAVNGELKDHPEYVNQDPYGKGWMIRIRLSDPAEMDKLLTAQEYEAYIQTL
jgi:glycine cleavage system H protein